MTSFDSTDRRKKIILFSIMLAISLGLVFFIGTSLSGKGNSTEKITETNTSALLSEPVKLLDENEKLQTALTALQQLDQQYAAVITDAEKSAAVNKLIQQAENNFRTLLDAVNETAPSLTNENIKARFTKMMTAYQQVLENRRAIGSLRNAVAMHSNNYSTDEKALLQLQDELMQKNNRIATLESTVKTMAKQPLAAAVKNDNSAVWMNKVNELETTVGNLNLNNNSLKQENERLLKQQIDNSKNAGSNEAVLKERTMALQQKIETLNAELQLANVDCNLSRVDAAQIISNAKQRKQLLSEASYILTNLSASANEEVKRKVKDKIVRLNQVAANSRE